MGKRLSKRGGKPSIGAVIVGVGIMAFAAICASLLTARNELPSRFPLRGAVKAITLPPDFRYEYGWLKDGSLWFDGGWPDRAPVMVSRPPYKRFDAKSESDAARAAIPRQSGDFILTPDGKWLIYRSGFSGSDQLACCLKDGRTIGLGHSPVAIWWKRDGSAAFSFRTAAGGQKVQVEVIPIPSTAGTKFATRGCESPTGEICPECPRSSLTLGPLPGLNWWIEGELPDGRLAFTTNSESGALFLVDPAEKRTIQELNPWTASLGAPSYIDPTSRTLESFALAPDGKRIVWQCHEDSTSLLPAVLYYRLHIGKAPKATTTSDIYVTDLTGRNPKLVAWMPEADLPNAISHAILIPCVTWLPDSRTLSLRDEDKLYIIPAGIQ